MWGKQNVSRPSLEDPQVGCHNQWILVPQSMDFGDVIFEGGCLLLLFVVWGVCMEAVGFLRPLLLLIYQKDKLKFLDVANCKLDTSRHGWGHTTSSRQYFLLEKE